MEFADLVKRIPTSGWSRNLASIEPRTTVWVQISELKYSNFDFNLEEGRNIKIIQPKYQNMIRLKISKYRLHRRRFLRPRRHFFSIFQALPKNQTENASTFQNPHKSFAPLHQKLKKIKVRKSFIYFDILTIFHILIFH